MKKFKIVILMFAFVLLFSAAAYAWGISYASDIHGSWWTVSGDSHTASPDVIAAEIYAKSWLYKAGILVSTGEDDQLNSTWAQANVQCSDDLLSQTYVIDGYHWVEYNNQFLTGNSTNHMYY